MEEKTIIDIEPIRNFNCKHYNYCLDYHAFRDLLEIDCYKCKQFEPDDLWRLDNPFAIGIFLMELFKEGGEVEEDD